MNPSTHYKKAPPLCLILFALGCFALLPNAQAIDPPPDGGYPGSDTAEDLSVPFNPASGVHNTAYGDGALENNRGNNNSAFGHAALRRNTVGNQNTATGALTLNNNSEGNRNTATGFQALLINTTGSRNTATGESALERNSAGNDNTATGVGALFRNTGDRNTATGSDALSNNTTGENNAAAGFQALKNNTTGEDNTATGYDALQFNTIGTDNTATGSLALYSNTRGVNNTAIGFGTLSGNTTGSNNTAIGFRAGASATTGANNIYIGERMLGFPGESNHTYVRNVNITSVSGGGADTVTVDLGTGLIGHLSSSRRYKQNIKPMDNTSEALYRLRPVTFRYKKDIDRTQSLAFGLVAEEVAQVNPALVAHDANGQPESIHYEMVNAMLLNEFLKEHSKVEKLEAMIAKQHTDFEAALADLKGQIQKVSAQFELKKPAPQTVLNDQ